MGIKQRFSSFLNKKVQPSSMLKDSPLSLEELTEDILRDYFKDCADVQLQPYLLGDKENQVPVLLLFCSGLAETKQINQMVLPQLEIMIKEYKFLVDEPEMLPKTLQLLELKGDIHQLEAKLFKRELILFFEKHCLFYSLNIANAPKRTPEESNTESSIKGPRDGFVEDISTNVSLIRRRIPNQSLVYEQFTIGDRSQTKVALLYLKDVISTTVIEEARKRLKKVEIDALITSAQLEEMLADNPYSLFPLIDHIGRPDFVVDSLLYGRFAVIVDSSPMVLLAPTSLTGMLKAPEDLHFHFSWVSIERLLRLLGIVLAIFFPGFWVALLSCNIEQVPFQLLATVTQNRQGLPLSIPSEMFGELILFDLLKEAGMRLPTAIGQTLALVGGLIIGDASIRAGFTSPSILVVAALSAVASFTLVNQTLSGTVIILKFLVLFLSSVLGVYGFVCSIIGIVLYLSTLTSFQIPILAPVSPPILKDLVPALIRLPWSFMSKRKRILRSMASHIPQKEDEHP